MDQHQITDGRVAAIIKAQGAELCSLRASDGAADAVEYIWQALPAWPRHAPILFPIVGRLQDDRLLHDGKSYRLTQHGFARDRTFGWLERTPTACRLVLQDDAETRVAYPFGFRLELHYALVDGALRITFQLTNTGTVTLPASMGAHPAFNWPLRPDLAPDGHMLRFAEPEPAPIRRLQAGLLRPETYASPVDGRELRLDESLFVGDAIIMDHVASRSVQFQAPAGASPEASVDVAWTGFRELGLWMKPGARFLCIEPWLGMASPAGFDGEFANKPGLMLIPPGQQRTAELRITPGAPGRKTPRDHTSKID